MALKKKKNLASIMSELKRSTVYSYQQYQPIVNLSDLIIQPNPGASLIGVQHQTTNNVYVRSNEVGLVYLPQNRRHIRDRDTM